MLFKRPVITVLFLYVFAIIIFEYSGMFAACNRSFLIFNANQKNITLSGKVLNRPVIKNKNQKFLLEVNSINDIKIKEKTLVYASSVYNIEYGDIVCLSGKLSKIEKPNFPYNFDYNLYLQRQNIYTKFYLYDFEFIEKKPCKIKQLALKINKDIEKKFQKFLKPPYCAMIESIFIGNMDFLDEDVKNAFVNTGLIHILVVSGLHVGFFASICVFIFKLTGLKLKYVYLLTIPAIFFYAFITGANAPAVRAAVMASCILLSLILKREPLIYNAVALSALLIFIFNPQTLFTASCQLSFAATLGIIYLYPKIRGIFSRIKNKIYKFILDIISVTFSAQLALLPVLMFYFAKLSVISIFTNVLIVPAAGFLVGLSFLFYICTFACSYIPLFFSTVLSLILKVILCIVFFFSDLKFSIIDVKVPSLIEIFLYYLVVTAMIEFAKSKKALSLTAVLIVLMGVFSFDKREFCRTFENDKNITVHIKNKYCGNVIIFEEIKKDKYYFDNLQQYLLACGITTVDKFYLKNPQDIQKRDLKIKIKQILIS